MRNWRIWWKMLRPPTLTAGAIPVVIGSALAFHTHKAQFNFWLFLTMMVATLLIQSATNIFNEYYDYKRGLDNADSVGIGGTIVVHGVKPTTVRNIGLSFYGAALLLGVYICAMSSWWLAIVGLISMLVGYLYTGGPLPIAYTPFGEVFAGFFMGFNIIAISHFIQTGEVTWNVWFISVPTMLLIGNILSANSIRDLDEDKEAGRKTIAVLLGRENAIILFAIIFIIAYTWLFFNVLFSEAPLWTWLAFLSAPKAIQAIRCFVENDTPAKMIPGMAATAKTNTIFGFLFAGGILIANYL